MGKLTTDSSTYKGSAFTYRDYNTTGDATSGDYNPVKLNIRAMFDLIESATGLIPNAAADGTTNDRAAITAVDALNASIRLCEGTYLVNSNLTIVSPLHILTGSKLKVPTGVTVTVKGGVFSDGMSQIFELAGTGKVVFSEVYSPAFVEWWGAVGDGDSANSAANVTAIEAALVAHPTPICGGNNYYVNSKIDFPTDANRILQTLGRDITTFTATHTDDPIFKIAGSGSTFIERAGFRGGFALVYENAVTVPGAMADDKDGACGLHVNLVSRFVADEITIYNPLLGCYFANVLAPDFDEILVIRSSVGATSRFRGFWIDGAASNPLAYPSPNPSTSAHRLRVSCGTVTAGGVAYGVHCKGTLADLWLQDCETGGGQYGAILDLTESATTSNLNVVLRRFVADAFTVDGINIIGNNAIQAAITIEDGYCAPAAGATGVGLRIEDLRGVSVKGRFEVDGHAHAGPFTACLLDTVYNVEIDGVAAKECAILFDATSCYEGKLIGSIYHSGTGSPTYTQAVKVATGGNLYIQPILSSPAAIWTDGVKLTSVTNAIVNMCGVVSGACSNMLRIDGTAVTSGGWTGSVCVQGFSGWNETGRINTTASASGGAGVNLPHGTAPSSPTNGDLWTSTGGLSARINGVTQTYFPYAGGAITGAVTINGNPPTAGKLGIVGDSGGVALAISDNVNCSLYVKTPSGGAQIGTDASGVLRLCSNGFTDAVYISAAQKVSVGPSAGVPAASAALDVPSTTLGFLPPCMTTTQKNAISSPASGLVVYDTTLGKLCVRGASAWETITSV